MKQVKAFGLFWWNFVVGDDWRVAVGVVIGLGLAALVEAWWVLPLAVAVVLAVSLRRAARSPG